MGTNERNAHFRSKFFNEVSTKNRRERERESSGEISQTTERKFEHDSTDGTVALGLKGGEKGGMRLSEPRVRLFISRKPVTSGN